MALLLLKMKQKKLAQRHYGMQINEDFDKPDIFTMVYPAETMLQGILSEDEAETYRSYMFALHDATQAAGMANVHQLEMDVTSIPMKDWCSAHPSAAADDAIAAQLSEFIVEKVPKWPGSTYPVIVDV